MFVWKEIKTWAKNKGYKADRTKVDNENNPYHYIWYKIDDQSICGETNSLSKIATDIFNHITNNAHIEYQKEYAEKLAQTDIDHAIEGW